MVTNISASLLQSYTICQRQAWLMSRQIVPDQEHPYIEMGRLLDDTTYSRDRKKLHFENLVLDLVRSEDGDLVVGEIKKSSRAQDSAFLQLAYYLYRLGQNGVEARGLLLFPEERKRISVELTPDTERILIDVLQKVEALINTEHPPGAVNMRYCAKCGYREFCWS